MQGESSTTSFLKKLADKDKQKTALLYAKGKENINSQVNHQPPLKKNKRTKTQTSITHPTQHSSETHWYLDCRNVKLTANHSRNIFNNWLSMPSGIIQFSKILQNESSISQFNLSNSDKGGNQDNRKSLIVQVWIAHSSKKYEFMQTFLDYALPLLKIGKGVWSVAAITNNKRYDLLSLDAQGTQLWKGKNPLSKVQLERQNLMKRVFGFSVEKEKQIGNHQTLAKVQFPHISSTIYFILRDPHSDGNSNAQLLIQQEVFIQNITNIQNISILRVDQPVYTDDKLFDQVLSKLNLKVKREEELSKNQRERYLKSMIEKLQGELQGKQEELKIYKSQRQESEVQQDFGIPSQRISMNQQRYMQLKRQIKQKNVKNELL